MKRTRALAVGLVLALATGAVTATTAAAALPEFTPPFPNPFTSTSGKLTLQTVGKLKVMCTADTNTGEVTGPVTALVTIRFTGCSTTALPGALCQSPNGAPGEIVTGVWLGKLGYINTALKEVGIDFSTPTGGPLAEFFCGTTVKGEVVGSVIGKLSPVNKPIKPGKPLKLKFTQKAGKQIPAKLEGEPIDVPFAKVGLGPLEEAGLSSADKLIFAAPITVIA